MTQHIAIIGAGYAGLSAGAYLAAQGYAVTVFEANKVLGGRARAIQYRGQTLDNGQHICLGAYTALLELMQQVGLSEAAVFLRRPLQLVIHPKLRFSMAKLPAPWHVFATVWRAQGLSWPDRYRLLKFLIQLKRHPPATQTVADWLAQQPAALIDTFWAPLCLATLNTPLETAAASIFAQVLRDSFGQSAAHCDLLLPQVDLSSALPNAAAHFIRQHGGIVQTGQRIQSIHPHGQRWQVGDGLFDQVVVAVAPQQLAQLTLPAELDSTVSLLNTWSYQPIATVYLQYPAEISLPYPMQGLAQATAQWIFDRGQTHGQRGLIAVVISAIQKNGPHDALVQQIRHELADFFRVHAAPIWYKVIVEKHATFSATPCLLRPAQKTAAPGLWLAGDYTVDGYPATLESAVRSGRQVGKLMMEYNNE